MESLSGRVQWEDGLHSDGYTVIMKLQLAAG